jgi:hypothetical protein
MSRLLIHVEGQTEEDFVNEVLRDYLIGVGYHSVSARLIGNARLRRNRGGIRPWTDTKKDIVRHLLQDGGCIVTTMVDFYGLPRQGDNAWPGAKEAALLRGVDKASGIETAILESVKEDVGEESKRFLPFIVIHEFEGLLFSDCSAFSRGIGRPDLEARFREVRRGFPTPEDINDSPQTAPSKRVEQLLPGYEKPLYGNLAALEIGLTKIREECPHFAGWLEGLEALL